MSGEVWMWAIGMVVAIATLVGTVWVPIHIFRKQRAEQRERAKPAAEAQLTAELKLGDRHGEGNALGNLGNTWSNLGEMSKAIEYCEQDLIIRHEIGDRRGEGIALHNLTLRLGKLGKRDKAVAKMLEALRIKREIESPHAAASEAWLRERGVDPDAEG